MKDRGSAKDLFALGERDDPHALQRARRLFAQVLEAPGGLRIQTIHSFAQTCSPLSRPRRGSPRVPADRGPRRAGAGAPHARRSARRCRGERQRSALIADVQCLSLRLGEAGAVEYLMHCARAGEDGRARPTQADRAQLRKIDEPAGRTRSKTISRTTAATIASTATCCAPLPRPTAAGAPRPDWDRRRRRPLACAAHRSNAPPS